MRNSSSFQAPRRIFTLPARQGELSGPVNSLFLPTRSLASTGPNIRSKKGAFKPVAEHGNTLRWFDAREAKPRRRIFSDKKSAGGVLAAFRPTRAHPDIADFYDRGAVTHVQNQSAVIPSDHGDERRGEFPAFNIPARRRDRDAVPGIVDPSPCVGFRRKRGALSEIRSRVSNDAPTNECCALSAKRGAARTVRDDRQQR